MIDDFIEPLLDFDDEERDNGGPLYSRKREYYKVRFIGHLTSKGKKRIKDKWLKELGVPKKLKVIKILYMYSETDGDSGDYNQILFSSKKKADDYHERKKDAYGRIQKINLY